MKQRDANFSLHILCLLSFVFCQIALFASQVMAETALATVRIGKHADFVRIVFTTDNEFAQKASVVLTVNNTIKVSFPSPATINAPPKGVLKNDLTYDLSKDVKITVIGNTCMMAVENIYDITVSKLSSPARLIIDAHTGRSSQKPSPDEIKPPSPIVKGAQEGVKSAVDEALTAFQSFAIDAGHGGQDSGLRDKNFTEKDIALSVAKDIAAALTKKGKKVFMTRKSDQPLSLKRRTKFSNSKSPDMFISIHISPANDIVVYSAPGKAVTHQKGPKPESTKKTNTEIDRNIAAAMTRNLKNDLNINARHEELLLPLIAALNSPAILIELPNPEKFKYDKKTRELLINSIFMGMAHPASAPDNR